MSGPAESIVLEPGQAAMSLRGKRSHYSVPMNPAVRSQPLTKAARRDLPSTFVPGSEDRIAEIVTPAFFDRDPNPNARQANWRYRRPLADSP